MTLNAYSFGPLTSEFTLDSRQEGGVRGNQHSGIKHNLCKYTGCECKNKHYLRGKRYTGPSCWHRSGKRPGAISLLTVRPRLLRPIVTEGRRPATGEWPAQVGIIGQALHRATLLGRRHTMLRTALLTPSHVGGPEPLAGKSAKHLSPAISQILTRDYVFSLIAGLGKLCMIASSRTRHRDSLPVRKTRADVRQCRRRPFQF